MKRLLLAAATVAVLSPANPSVADEVTVAAEQFTFEATVTLPQFPCPLGCAGSGRISITSLTGGPRLNDNVSVSATDSAGCVAGSFDLTVGTATQSSTTTFDLTRATFALAGTAVYDQYAIPRVRDYVVEAAMTPVVVDPAALTIACLAGTPLRNVTFTITGTGERAAVRRTQ